MLAIDERLGATAAVNEPLDRFDVLLDERLERERLERRFRRVLESESPLHERLAPVLCCFAFGMRGAVLRVALPPHSS